MSTSAQNMEVACREAFNRYFSKYLDGKLQRQVTRVLGSLLAENKTLAGKSAGWAAGIIYGAVNDTAFLAGFPGFSMPKLKNSSESL
jgi:hypothetical protein